MKTLRLIALSAVLLATIFVISCSNNTEEPTIDCNASNLSITVTDQMNAGCQTLGSITVDASGGAGSYMYSSDGVNFQSSATFPDLSAGSFTFTVRDADECTATVSAVLQGNEGSVSLSLSATDTQCGGNSGTITATATGGDENYMYSLNGGAAQASNVFSGLGQGSNEVTATDGEGCEATQTILVETGISLSNDIVAIITSNCAISGCHAGAIGPDLSTPAAVMANSDRVKARTSAGTMPPASQTPLSQNEIDLIACWVDDGAQDN